MYSRRRILYSFLIIALAVSLGGCASSSQWPVGLNSAARRHLRALPPVAVVWHGGPSGGRIIQTRHYRIYTTIDNPLQQRLMARVLEADFARFIRLVPGAKPKLPMVGYVFRDRSQWVHYTRKVTGAQARIYLRIDAGGYERAGVFAVYRSNVAEVLSVLAHEAWHQFSFLALKDHLPAWLDEGLATQCEAMRWRNGYPIFTPWLNAPRWEMLRTAIQGRQLLPLREFARTQAGSVVMHNGAYVRAYYAEVWSFMLFLEHSRYRPELLELLTMAKKGKLNNLLSRSGLTKADKRNLTLRWNRIAGEIFLHHFFTCHPGLKQRYVNFIDHLVKSWPPAPPKHGPVTAARGATS